VDLEHGGVWPEQVGPEQVGLRPYS